MSRNKTEVGNIEKLEETGIKHLSVVRGSLVVMKECLGPGSELAIVVSNDVQNSNSDYLLVAPLERRVSRLKAPFAVDLGRHQGMRDLHVVRCDWVTCVSKSEILRVERARMQDEVISALEPALSVALGFRGAI